MIYFRVYEVNGTYYSNRAFSKNIQPGREIFTLEGEDPGKLEEEAKAEARKRGIASVANLY